MNTVRKGNEADNRVATYAESRGWLIGGRRHRKGGGDQIWIRPGYRSRLVEVKASDPADPWENFRPGERADLLERARVFDCDAFLALSPREGVPTLIPAKDFPS